MGANLNRILVVDVEATCWETREEQGDRPNEVIEIGITEVDLKHGKIGEPTSYLIKPRFTTVSPFCTQLTGWKPEDLADAGEPLDILTAIKQDFGIQKDDLWCSYGEFDRIKLGCEGRASMGGLYGIRRHENPFAFMRTHINIKTLFAVRRGLSKEVAMDKALNIAGQKMEGRHHNGADDSFNIAKLVLLTLK